MHCLFTSVFPAPLSPDTTSDWCARRRIICMYAASAIEKVCGGRSGWPGPNFLQLAISSGAYSFGMYLPPKSVHGRGAGTGWTRLFHAVVSMLCCEASIAERLFHAGGEQG